MKVTPKMTAVEAARAREKEKHERALRWGPVVKTWSAKVKVKAAKA